MQRTGLCGRDDLDWGACRAGFRGDDGLKWGAVGAGFRRAEDFPRFYTAWISGDPRRAAQAFAGMTVCRMADIAWFLGDPRFRGDDGLKWGAVGAQVV